MKHNQILFYIIVAIFFMACDRIILGERCEKLKDNLNQKYKIINHGRYPSVNPQNPDQFIFLGQTGLLKFDINMQQKDSIFNDSGMGFPKWHKDGIFIIPILNSFESKILAIKQDKNSIITIINSYPFCMNPTPSRLNKGFAFQSYYLQGQSTVRNIILSDLEGNCYDSLRHPLFTGVMDWGENNKIVLGGNRVLINVDVSTKIIDTLINLPTKHEVSGVSWIDENSFIWVNMYGYYKTNILLRKTDTLLKFCDNVYYKSLMK